MHRHQYALTLLILFTCTITHAQTTNETVTAEEFATFGVKVTAPPDWKRLPEDGPDSMAKWALPGGSGPESPGGVVIVRLESARGKSAQSYAKEIAGKFSGEARSESSGLGDAATWRVTFTKPVEAPPGQPPVPQPKALLVAVHGEYLYAVWGLENTPGTDVEGAVEELRRNWSFTDLQRPSSTRGLRENPIMMLGKIQMRPASTLRAREQQERTRGKAIEMQIFNWRSGRADLVMTAEVDRRPAKLSLDDIGKALLGQMSLKEDPEKPIRWKKVDGPTPRIISTSFEGARSGGRSVPLRFALIELNEKEICLLGFVFPTTDPTDREIYEDLTEAMTSTVESVKK